MSWAEKTVCIATQKREVMYTVDDIADDLS